MVALSLSGEEPPPQHALALAAIAGLAGVMGLAAFYAALAVGPMSLVAPAVAAIGSALPAAVGLLGGDHLTPVQLTGLAAAVLAVVIVSGAGQEGVTSRFRPAALGRIAAAGLGFASFFVLMDAAAAQGAGPWWSILAARSAPLIVLALIIGARVSGRTIEGRTTRQPGGSRSRSVIPLIAIAGMADVGGNAFFLLANQQVPFSIAAVVSSLYPVTTALLAWTILGERIGRWQAVGVAVALAGVALLSF